jgi:predicted NAD/FAD-binding protein
MMTGVHRDPPPGKGPLRVAVAGGGVAGIVAAHLLQERHEVTLLERNDYLGGHTHTVVIPDGPDAGTPVDTGFIVLNDRTYPLFTTFLDRLGVPTRYSEMSFSFCDAGTGFCFSGTGLNGLFAQRRNLLRPSFYRMLAGIVRFCREARQGIQAGTIPDVTLGEYLETGRYPAETVENYVLPMAGAIWSSRPVDAQRFPVFAFLRFFDSHGLLSLRDRPRWLTVRGGSHTYVRAFQARFTGEIRLGSRVVGVDRRGEGVTVRLEGGQELGFDRVVIAAHADEALAMLDDPSPDESRLLGAWSYQSNRTTLHTDTAALPPSRRAWASWNYTRESGEGGERPVSVSYYMNRLQGLSAHNHYCVSLNRRTPLRSGSVIAEMEYRHPTYTFPSMATQIELPALNGRSNTWFCGSYFGYGFHEDAVRSAVEVGRQFGVEL